VLGRLRAAPAAPSTVALVLAPERYVPEPGPGPLHLRLHDPRRICALRAVNREDKTLLEYNAALDASAAELDPRVLSDVVHRLQAKSLDVSRLDFRGDSNLSDEELSFCPAGGHSFPKDDDSESDSYFDLPEDGSPLYHLVHRLQTLESEQGSNRLQVEEERRRRERGIEQRAIEGKQ